MLFFSDSIDIRMELTFLLDVSAQNIQPEQFPNVLQFIKSTYGRYHVGQDRTRVGIVTYDEGGSLIRISLDQYTTIESLDIRVDQISLSPLPGPGRLGQGLTAVETQLFNGKTRPQTPKILVVITGGTSADDARAPSAKLRKLNTTMFSVGVGHNVDTQLLGLVATPPASDHVLLTSISHRETAGGNLASRIKKSKLEKKKRYFSILVRFSYTFICKNDDMKVNMFRKRGNNEIMI